MAELPNETIDKVFNAGYRKGRADAIDEFANLLADKCECTSAIRSECNKGNSCMIWEYAKKLKEQNND